MRLCSLSYANLRFKTLLTLKLSFEDAEENRLSQPLNDILTRDEELYGIDEILGLAVVNLYGFIEFNNYSYLDKVKPGVIKKIG